MHLALIHSPPLYDAIGNLSIQNVEQRWRRCPGDFSKFASHKSAHARNSVTRKTRKRAWDTERKAQIRLASACGRVGYLFIITGNGIVHWTHMYIRDGRRDWRSHMGVVGFLYSRCCVNTESVLCGNRPDKINWLRGSVRVRKWGRERRLWLRNNII